MGTGNRTASVKDLAQGPAQVIISEPNAIHVQAVTVEQAETKQILKPLLELKPGQHYAIIVDAGGKATGTVK